MATWNLADDEAAKIFELQSFVLQQTETMLDVGSTWPHSATFAQPLVKAPLFTFNVDFFLKT